MRTDLYENHCQLGAKIVNFAGWEMPLHYTGIMQEHLAVRQTAGLFDVSHMGRISITGKDAASFLDYLCTNHIADRKNFTATYTAICNADGGTVDDLIVYREELDSFFLIVNAGNRQKDLKHLQEHAKKFDVQVEDHYRDGAIIALQGPAAQTILSQLFPSCSTIKTMHFNREKFEQGDLIISKTGYTGSGGFELYGSSVQISVLWKKLLKCGAPFGLVPAGLGARDTLRLEMGYALYGHELSETIPPTESVSAWTVRFEKKDFLGKKALLELEKSPVKRSEYGIVLLDKGIAREGYPVFYQDQEIGNVTSGTYGPTIAKAVGIVLVKGKLKLGDPLEILIREKRVKAEVIPLPFYTP